jgi:hypothetical protein
LLNPSQHFGGSIRRQFFQRFDRYVFVAHGAERVRQLFQIFIEAA